jgi:molybdopterin-guanine dinucleotide biosynthesis protein
LVLLCAPRRVSSATSKVLVIAGGPGVGKTTLVNGILRILSAKGVGLMLCAPTGRAAKRMNEATGFDSSSSTSTIVDSLFFHSKREAAMLSA